MRKKILYTFLLLLSSPVVAHDLEGINLDLTRVIFDSQQNSASIKVNNFNKNKSWLLRSWISNYSDDGKSKSFIITPILYRVLPNESIQLKIEKTDDLLPTDRESVFRINVLAIPPKEISNDKTSSKPSDLQFAINSRIKLIYRPHKLNETDKVNAAFKSLKILKKNEYISIENATPYYITMDNVKINNKKVTSIEDFMVAPYSEFKIPTQNAKSFSYTTINDYGGKNPIIDIKF